MPEFFLREMFLAEKMIPQCGKIYVDKVVQGSFSMSLWTIFSNVFVSLSISGMYSRFTDFMIQINTELHIANSWSLLECDTYKSIFLKFPAVICM